MEFTSKVPRWKGKIHTADWMTWPNMIAWEEAIEDARKLGEDPNVSLFYDKLLPATLRFIERVEIPGLPEKLQYEDVPASPRFVAFLVDSISELYQATNKDTEEKKLPEPS